MTPENVLSEWSRLLVESFADAGVREAVISPGSRSTPLAWAFSSSSRIRCRSIVDERSAAFFALGHGRAIGFPVVVLCTSGSAAANYFPAIVEASLSRTPLVVITADRPFELQDASASQTIDQTKMYGDYVRRFVDLGMPEALETALASLRRKAAQTISDTMGPEPGPVHLNFRARKPLEPAAATTPAARDLAARVDALLARGITKASAPRRHPSKDRIDALARDCASAERGLIVCGPCPIRGGPSPAAVATLASRTGYPVYAEATSQVRFGASLDPSAVFDGLDVLLRARAFRDSFNPDLVLQLGQPPVSGAWERFVAGHPAIPRHVFSTYGWPDPHGTAKTIIVADEDEAVLGLAGAIDKGTSARATRWASSLARANATAWRVVDGVLADDTGLSEGAAVRAVVDALPESGVLSFGNSLPVRHADVFVRHRGRGIAVISQRGASGIDGIVSATAGGATALGRPTTLVVGDISALHDLGGFAAAASVEVPLVIVVLNNDGGRIFEQLPLARMDIGEDRMKLWTTPHGRDFSALADLFDVRYGRPTSIDGLRAAVTEGASRVGCTLLEVTVPPQGARRQYDEITARLDRELSAIGSE